MGRISKVRMLRRSRAMWASPRLWRPRLVFWIGALGIGCVSVLFAKLADAAQHVFTVMTAGNGWSHWLPLVVTPAGVVLCAYLAHVHFPGSQGSGIPQAIAARHLREEEDRSHLLSLRMIIGKILLTVTGLLCGASIGREGPTVQVGASLMFHSAKWSGMGQVRGLILAGSAAGIAAAFNTPLAGIVFAIEEMSRTYQARTNGIILSAVILAGLASLGLVGNYTYFGTARFTGAFPGDWPVVLACGVMGGLLGGIFSLVTLKATRRLRRWFAPAPLKRTLIFAAGCGAAIALLGLVSGGLTFGTGYDQARFAIEGQPLPWIYFIEKFLAGLFSTLSGIPGGLFAPSLSVGAGLGSSIGLLFGANVGFAALLGMAGYFAGVVQAPMTSFVIVLEMTGNHDNVIPLMLAAMLGYGTARIISHEPLYHALSRLFIADAIRRKRADSTAAE